METSQLSSFFQDALRGSSVEKPGRIYSSMCAAFPLQRIKNKRHHALALNILTKLSQFLQSTGGIPSQEKKQVLDYMDALGLLVEDYEKETFAVNLKNISGADILEFLMEQHSLRQVDLAGELGSQSIVSEILSHKRKLNSQQIYALSKRFGISPAAFFPISH